jgi:hypothetical protein
MEPHNLNSIVRFILVKSTISFLIFNTGINIYAGYLPVYGGPTYTPGIGGYVNQISENNNAVNNSGIAIGSATKHDAADNNLGAYALRWDPTGISNAELGNLGLSNEGYVNSGPSAINNLGIAVGSSEKYVNTNYIGSRAVRWNASETAATELSTLTTNITYNQYIASAITDSGVIVGGASYFAMPISYSCAVRWDSSGIIEELGNLGTDRSGHPHSGMSAINSAGTIVGSSQKFDYSGKFLGQAAVRWSASGTVATELDHVATESDGYFNCVALAINDAGTAVGYDDRGLCSVRWDASGTAATALDKLGAETSSGAAGSAAVAINSAGIIVGGSVKSFEGINLGYRAVRWDAVGTSVHELGNLGTDSNGVTSCYVSDINSSGMIVGCADVMGNVFERHAVLWDTNDVAIDLNTLIDPTSGWVLTNATDITDTGWIAGHGMFDPDGTGGQDAYQRLFLIQIPEPNLFVILAGAILTIFCIRQRNSIT